MSKKQKKRRKQKALASELVKQSRDAVDSLLRAQRKLEALGVELGDDPDFVKSFMKLCKQFWNDARFSDVFGDPNVMRFASVCRFRF